MEPPKLIICPVFRQAVIFCQDMGWPHPERHPDIRVAMKPMDLRGMRLDRWEVWWLDRLWPCRTHEDVEAMLNMKMLARMYGADIHHWWT